MREDSDAFAKVQHNLDTIFITSEHGNFNEVWNIGGGWTWVTEGSIIEDPSFPPEYLASVLIHEAQHVTQYTSGRHYTDEQAERGAYLVQLKFLKTIKFDNAVTWLRKQYNAKWWREKDSPAYKKKRSKNLRLLKKLERGSLRCE